MSAREEERKANMAPFFESIARERGHSQMGEKRNFLRRRGPSRKGCNGCWKLRINPLAGGRSRLFHFLPRWKTNFHCALVKNNGLRCRLIMWRTSRIRWMGTVQPDGNCGISIFMPSSFKLNSDPAG